MTHFMVVTPFPAAATPEPRVAIQVANIFELVPNPKTTPLNADDFGCTIKYVNGEQKVYETMEEVVELANGAKVAARNKRAAPPAPNKATPAPTSSILTSATAPAAPAPLSETAPAAEHAGA